MARNRAKAEKVAADLGGADVFEEPSAAAQDRATAERLWQTCAEQTALPK